MSQAPILLAAGTLPIDPASSQFMAWISGFVKTSAHIFLIQDQSAQRAL
jgi:hypothetical protein